jgi:hypothetical protein
MSSDIIQHALDGGSIAVDAGEGSKLSGDYGSRQWSLSINQGVVRVILLPAKGASSSMQVKWVDGEWRRCHRSWRNMPSATITDEEGDDLVLVEE